MWIYLTRHAETTGNIDRIVQTPETPLSQRGERQAQQLAAAYSTLPISCILSSDYARTMQTATNVHNNLGCEFIRSELLRERHFGALRGKHYDDIGHDFFAHDYHPPNGESYPEFVQRVELAWQEITRVASKTQDDIMVVTHGLVVRCILTEILCLPTDLLEQIDVKNTSVTKINKNNLAHIPDICDISHLVDDALIKHE